MDYQQIVERLKEQGKITDEDINGIENEEEESIKALAIFLHSLLCTKNHVSIEEYAVSMPGCSFYAEQHMDDCWKLQASAAWLNVAREYAKRFPGFEDRYDETIRICDAVTLMSDPDMKEVVGVVTELLRLYRVI